MPPFLCSKGRVIKSTKHGRPSKPGVAGELMVKSCTSSGMIVCMKPIWLGLSGDDQHHGHKETAQQSRRTEPAFHQLSN